MEWVSFFPAHTRVLALPNWKTPRLFIQAQSTAQRWSRSAFYPAFRLSARLYRFALRARAATATMQTRMTPTDEWALEELVEDVLPQTTSVSVLVGSPGPAQKITVQLWNEAGRVIGYLKYAEKDAARKRLHQEHEVLNTLPPHLGPAPLKYGPWQAGEALLTTPLLGRCLPASLPPPDELVSFCQQLVVAPPVPIEEHPWMQSRQQENLVCTWIEQLSGRRWPVVVQHGDLVWNLRRCNDDHLNAFDWEYGTLQGFPGLDLATYILQLAVLIYRWKPVKALTFAVDYLSRETALALSEQEATALVGLAAYEAYRHLQEDGYPPETPIQLWRRSVWEHTTCATSKS